MDPPVTGRVVGRIVNSAGADSQSIFVQNNPMPYTPATRDTASATLVTRTSETIDGKVSGERAVPAGNVLRPSNQTR